MSQKLNKKIGGVMLSVAMLVGVSVAPSSALAAHEGTQGYVTVDKAVYSKILADIAVTLNNLSAYLDTIESGSDNPSTETPAADLRVTMNNLFSEHVDVSAEVMRNIIDDSSDLEASKEAQMNNAVEIAQAFGSLYGSNVEELVGEAFIEHIEFSNEYAEAVDDMNQAAKDDADEELDEYLREISVLLASVIDTVDEETAYSVLRDHEDLLNQAAEQYKSGDYSQAYQTEREALKQIQVVSDVLSQGVVDTMPEDF